MRRWIFPGSFDPLTLGHVDLLSRAHRLCDELIVAVLHNPRKQGLLLPAQRIALIEEVCGDLPGLRVIGSDRLLVQVAQDVEAQCVVRGLRTSGDSALEIQMAQLNRTLSPGLEVLLMTTAPQYAFISSSFVREIAEKGGDISAFVPPRIEAAINKILAGKQEEETL